MIVAAVDDLFFASKIGQTARNLKLPVVFVKSRAAALEAAQAKKAVMMIVDLNSSRCEPMSLIRSMKEDSVLRSVPIVGFVSHVQSDLIHEARESGCDRVLARSAFSEQLPQILAMTEEPPAAFENLEKGSSP